MQDGAAVVQRTESPTASVDGSPDEGLEPFTLSSTNATPLPATTLSSYSTAMALAH